MNSKVLHEWNFHKDDCLRMNFKQFRCVISLCQYIAACLVSFSKRPKSQFLTVSLLETLTKLCGQVCLWNPTTEYSCQKIVLKTFC